MTKYDAGMTKCVLFGGQCFQDPGFPIIGRYEITILRYRDLKEVARARSSWDQVCVGYGFEELPAAIDDKEV